MNCGTVSVTSIPGKILASIIKGKFGEHLEKGRCNPKEPAKLHGEFKGQRFTLPSY